MGFLESSCGAKAWGGVCLSLLPCLSMLVYILFISEFNSGESSSPSPSPGTSTTTTIGGVTVVALCLMCLESMRRKGEMSAATSYVQSARASKKKDEQGDEEQPSGSGGRRATIGSQPGEPARPPPELDADLVYSPTDSESDPQAANAAKAQLAMAQLVRIYYTHYSHTQVQAHITRAVAA